MIASNTASIVPLRSGVSIVHEVAQQAKLHEPIGQTSDGTCFPQAVKRSNKENIGIRVKIFFMISTLDNKMVKIGNTEKEKNY